VPYARVDRHCRGRGGRRGRRGRRVGRSRLVCDRVVVVFVLWSCFGKLYGRNVFVVPFGCNVFVFVSTLCGSTCVEFVSNRYRNRSRKPSRGEVVFVGCVVVVVVVVCGVGRTSVSTHAAGRIR